jgi:hypothetical protein
MITSPPPRVYDTICPHHSRPPCLAGIQHPLTPDDTQLKGLSPCERAEAVFTFAELGHEYAVRVAEADGQYAEVERLRLHVAELEAELLKLRHESELPPWKHWKLIVARVQARRSVKGGAR